MFSTDTMNIKEGLFPLPHFIINWLIISFYQLVVKKISFDHSHGSDVSDLKKHTFEHKFAKQCVEREVRNSVNKANDRKRYAKPCMCIAKRIMKNLTAVEAEKFLVEKKSTQSLKMSFDEAAYFCLQTKAKVKSPVLFGKK